MDATTIPMTDTGIAMEPHGTGEAVGTQALLRLMSWLSPAFPIGAFSYSSGLEQAVQDGAVTDAILLQDWLAGSLGQGAAWNDAVLLAEACRGWADAARLTGVASLAEAMAGSRQRQMETMLQGEAFLAAASAWLDGQLAALSGRAAYPVAVGAVSGVHRIGLEAATAAYLHAGVSNQISVAIRCGILGQRDGVAMLAALEGDIAASAGRAAASTLDDLGSAGILADIAALRHETLGPRLFRS